jgi:hypothetical protein
MSDHYIQKPPHAHLPSTLPRKKIKEHQRKAELIARAAALSRKQELKQAKL